MTFLNPRRSFSGQALSDDQLRQIAPSIFALEPWQAMSDRYRFIPTIDVVNKMRSEGFLPVAAFQGRTRLPGKEDYTRHMVRFRQEGDVVTRGREVGDSVMELVLLNAHDGTAGYQLDAGVHRVVCKNGMIVSSGNVSSVRVRHSGAKDLPAQVIDASFEIIEQAPAVMGQIAEMREIRLDRPRQLAFANAALELRESAIQIDADELLEGRRYQDDAGSDGRRDLWTTLNVVQEHLIRGGDRGTTANNRTLRTRKVTSIPENVRLNKGLWRLAEEMKKLAA